MNNNSMFVIISNYKAPLDKIDEIRGEHLAFINNYVLAGTFLTVGRKNPVDGAIILAHNSTKEELENIFKNDPYYTNGFAEYSITEFSPAMFSMGIEEALEKLKF